jgi:hypothetical protein
MKWNRRVGPVLFMCVLLGGLGGGRSFALSLSGLEAGVGTGQSYNRSFYYFWDTGAFVSAEFDESLTVTLAAALERRQGVFCPAVSPGLAYSLPFWRPWVPLSFTVTYLCQSMESYETTMHTLLPALALDWKWFGFSLGYTLRWTRFAGEKALFEPVLAYRIYGNLYRRGAASIGVRISNFGNFYADNIGSYHAALDNNFELAENIFIACALEVIFSGNVGRITSVYGISFSEGIVFRW